MKMKMGEAAPLENLFLTVLAKAQEDTFLRKILMLNNGFCEHAMLKENLISDKIGSNVSLICTGHDLSTVAIFFSVALKTLNSNIYTGKEVPGRKPKKCKHFFQTVWNIQLFGRYLGGKLIWLRMGTRCGGGLRKMGLSLTITQRPVNFLPVFLCILLNWGLRNYGAF